METAYWLDSFKGNIPNYAQRIYIGHETYVDRIPPLPEMIKTVQRLLDSDKQITLVTPFLTENDLNRICEMIEAISELSSGYEVVCNDWGLLHRLTESHFAEPTVGRLLVGQATDPRLAAFDQPERQLPHERIIRHADGTKVELRYRRPGDHLLTHLRSCSIAEPKVISFLHGLGIRRLEVSNTLQGIQMSIDAGWRVTLHLPEVPIAIARHCQPANRNQWFHPSFPVTLFSRDNYVFYCNNNIPSNFDSLGIDRLVCPTRD